MATNAKIKITAEDKTRRAFQSVNSSLKGFSSGLAGAFLKLSPLLGVAGIGALTAQSLKSVDALAKTADKLDITTKSLASLEYLTKIYSSASAPAMSEALTKATKRLGEFNATGGGASAVWLKKLNLDTQELAGLKPDELFKRYSSEIGKLSTRGEQLAAISALMGDESRALIGIIDAGAGVFDDAAERVDKFGTGISRIEASRIEDANDAISNMQEAMKGLGISIAVELAPKITQFINWMLDIEERLDSLSESQLQNRLADTLDALTEINDQIKLNAATQGLTAIDPFLLKQAESLGKRYAEINTILGNIKEKGDAADSAPAVQTDAETKQLAKIQREEELDRKRLTDKFERLNISLLNEQDRLRLDLEERALIVEEAFQFDLITDAERKETLLAINQEYEDQITDTNERALQERSSNEEKWAKKILAMKFSLAQQAIGFIELVAGKNKAVGKLIIIAQKGLAIAQTQINTEVASMRAIAELGPVLGPPAAATIRGLGAASIALIGATGIAQLAGAGVGGSGVGGVPVSSTVSSTPAPPPTIADNANQGTTGTINIHVTGVLTQEIIDSALIPAIRESIDTRDVILINSNSRNARELSNA